MATAPGGSSITRGGMRSVGRGGEGKRGREGCKRVKEGREGGREG